jgi:hypothetical protein
MNFTPSKFKKSFFVKIPSFQAAVMPYTFLTSKQKWNREDWPTFSLKRGRVSLLSHLSLVQLSIPKKSGA